MVSVFSFALLDSNNCDSKWLFTKLTGYQYIVLWKGACRPDDDPNTRQLAPVLGYQQLFQQQNLTLIKCRALPQIMRCQQILPQCSSLSKLWSRLGQGPAKISQYGGSGPSRNISIRKTQGPLNLSFIHDYFLDKAVRFDVSTCVARCVQACSQPWRVTFPFSGKGSTKENTRSCFAFYFKRSVSTDVAMWQRPSNHVMRLSSGIEQVFLLPPSFAPFSQLGIGSADHRELEPVV